MGFRCGIAVISWIFFGVGLASELKVSLDRSQSGFFLKPLDPASKPPSFHDHTKHFVVTRPLGTVSVRAEYGPLSVTQQIPQGLLGSGLVNHTVHVTNVVRQDLDISAHLVSRTITQERPLLQVLFHASQVEASPPVHGKVKGTTEPQATLSKWCLQMHVQKDNTELTSVCVLSSDDNVCISELTLPTDWWDDDVAHTGQAEVYYSVYGIDQNLQCSSASNSIVPGKADLDQIDRREKTFIDSVTLTHGQMTYQELKEDQHILVYVPQKSFFPGSKFRVPVKLQVESDLQVFVIKMKARRGLRVVGAEASDPDVWRITLDLNHKKHGAMVTAFVKDKNSYSKMDRVQSIFDWIIEVDSDATGEDRGRLSLTLEYEMNTQSRESYGSVENRVLARVEIQNDNTYAIVPVIKTLELVNVALLTGAAQSLPMRVYSISQIGKISDITSQTTCHSGDDTVLKVAQSCNLVFLDGSETKGSSSVSVIAKYGRHTKFLFFKVWVPELPLVVDLSDEKLSQIKGWKAPIQPNKSGASRQTRGVDFGILTHPDLQLFQEDGLRSEDLTAACRLRYQQAVAEIYTNFYIAAGDGGKPLYLLHRKAQFRVTPLLVERLRIADVSIAQLKDNVIEGVKPGRTEIQVLTRFGRVIGAHEVKVLPNKVEIQRLETDVITDLHMAMSPDPQWPGVLLAMVHTQSKLLKKYQEGILDISLTFDDGTKLPLRHVAEYDYFLDLDTLYNHIVAFGPMLAPHTPKIIALGEGKGEMLKLSLGLGDACQRKKSKPLAVSYVYVDIDFTKGPETNEGLQNDVGFNSRGPGHFGDNSDSDVKAAAEAKEGKTKEMGTKDGQDYGNSQEKSDWGTAQADSPVGFQPRNEAQRHIVEVHGMTPLEIGMYVLLAVFCVAIVVFMVNCMVFVVRYKKKQKVRQGKDPVSNANDWVWIGKATLERNAINTACSQALIPEADFNGNHGNNAAAAMMQLLPPPPPPTGTLNNRNSGASANSNRNSVVSTYKGSECSIRITANPLPDDLDQTDDDILEEESQPEPSSATSTSEHPRSDSSSFQGEDGDSSSLSEGPSGGTGRRSMGSHSGTLKARQEAARREAMHNALLENLRAQQDSANGNISDAEWDYEAMGMTYEQLMEYFDNLKESTA